MNIYEYLVNVVGEDVMESVKIQGFRKGFYVIIIYNHR